MPFRALDAVLAAFWNLRPFLFLCSFEKHSLLASLVLGSGTFCKELATLRDAAQHGIQGRAAHYALASHGPRMASSVEEKSMALEGYLKLVT